MVETGAQIYSQYRPRYPQRLVDDLRERTAGEHGERLIDWGCGTGELTLRLSPYFDRVLAVDIGSQGIALAKEKAREKAIENIEWRVNRAEEIQIERESCDLVTSASAFHWMDRETLSSRAFEGLRPGGSIAIAGGAGDDIRSGRKEWHRVAIECLWKYLDRPSQEETHGGRTRAQQGGESSSSDTSPGPSEPTKRWHTDFLEAAGFHVESLQHPTEFVWPVDEVAGYMYSITGGLPWRLGDQREAFERDFSEALTGPYPSGFIRETIDFYLIVGTKSGG